METPLDLLSRAAVLVREQEIPMVTQDVDKETSDTASDCSIHSDGSSFPEQPRKRHDRPRDKETLKDPSTRSRQSAKRSVSRTHKQQSSLLRAERQGRNDRSHSSSPTSAATTLSPCSCCGSAFPCPVPVQPLPLNLGSSVFSHHPYLQAEGISSRYHCQPFTFQSPQPIGCTVGCTLPSRPSGLSAFTRPITKWSQSHSDLTTRNCRPAFDIAEHSPLAQSPVSLKLLARPVPRLPQYVPYPDPRLRLPLDMANKSVKQDDPDCSPPENLGSPSSPTQTVIDEHFRRSLAGHRLRQFYPFPTSDGDSVNDHFKRALGENWERVEPNVPKPCVNLNRTEKQKSSVSNHWSLC